MYYDEGKIKKVKFIYFSISNDSCQKFCFNQQINFKKVQIKLKIACNNQRFN